MAQQANSLDEFVLAEIKGGAYGKIFVAEYYGTVCAAKEFNLNLSLEVSSKGAQENILMKCQRMLQLRNPNIVQFLGVYYKPGLPTVPLLVIKMLNCSLSTLLECHPDVPIDVKLSILLGVSLGLKFLHSQKPSMVHCNLSSNNILLTPHLQAKISDVGGAAIVPEKSVKKYMKTTYFVTPEICKSSAGTLTGKIFDLSVEVFTYCVTTLHCITQQRPEPKRQLNSKVNQYIDKVISGDKKLGVLVEDEKIKRIAEKHAVTKKTVITCQTEMQKVAEQKNQLKIKKMEQSKRKQKEIQQKMEQSKRKQKEIQQLKYKNELLCKQISVADSRLKVGDLQTMVRNLDELLELKRLEIVNLDKQINSSHQQPSHKRISKSSDVRKEVCTTADKKDNELQEERTNLACTNLAQNDATPQKQISNEPDKKDKDENKKSSRINSQQDQPKEQKQTSYQDNEIAYHGNTNHLEQENRKDDDTDQQQSHRDEQYIQDGSRKNEKSDSIVKGYDSSQYKKVQNTTNRDRSSRRVLRHKESKCVTEQQENELKKEKLSESKENSRSIQKSVKSATKIFTRRNSRQANVTSPKNETGEQEVDNKQKSSRGNSQQDKPKKQKKKMTKKVQATNQDNTVTVTNDQLGQDAYVDRKDDDMDQQLLSNRDGRDNSKKNRRSDSNTKGQKSTSTSRDSHDQLGPKVIGFYNEGNTCFFNAMLQCIHQTTDLHYAIAKGKREYKINTSKGPLVIEVTKKSGQLTVDMRRLFYEISRQTGPISPHNLLQTIGRRNSRFGHGTQEDSHEVLRYLLSVLREEEIECIKRNVLSQYGIEEELLIDKSVDKETKLVKECLSKVSKGVCDIDRIFGSYLISTTICHECKIPLQTTEFNFDLSLPMPEDTSHAKGQNYCEVPIHPSKKKYKGQGVHTLLSGESSRIPEVVKSQQKFNLHLQEGNFFHCSYSDTKDLKLETALEHSLLAFTSIDTLDEDNKFICQACSYGKSDIVLCCVSKQILIHELSPVLILHIKRFSIESLAYRVTKDNRPLPFPFVLDMAPFCTTECIETYGDTDRKILYGLYAAVEHIGSLHGGHYATYVRRRPLQEAKYICSARHSMQSTDVKLRRKYNRRAAEEGEWYYTNDSHTSKCNPNTVLNCRPYLLFYEMLPKM